MIKTRWVTLLTICLLWAAAGFADDVQPTKTDREQLSTATISIATMLAESEHPSLWRPFHPVEATAYADNPLRPVADFHIQDTGVLSRVSKLRRLSLLTLAEFGQTRLFLGIDEEGLVGLHFNVLPQSGSERYLEVARMPYLPKTSRGAESK